MSFVAAAGLDLLSGSVTQSTPLSPATQTLVVQVIQISGLSLSSLWTMVGRRAGSARTGLAGLADTGISGTECVNSLSRARGLEDLVLQSAPPE